MLNNRPPASSGRARLRAVVEFLRQLGREALDERVRVAQEREAVAPATEPQPTDDTQFCEGSQEP